MFNLNQTTIAKNPGQIWTATTGIVLERTKWVELVNFFYWAFRASYW